MPRQEVGQLVGLEEVAEPVPDRDLRDLRDPAEIARLGSRRNELSFARNSEKSLLAPVFEQTQAVLHLGEAELELLELVPGDEPDLREEPLQRLPRSFRDAGGVPSPARHRVVEQLPRLVAAHAAPLGQLVGERFGAFGGESDRADRGERDPLEQLPRRSISHRWLLAFS